MKSLEAFVSLVIALFSVLGVAHAATIRVPSDQPRIQDAIYFAVDGDTVLVAPGVYFENIDFLGKAITVTSEADPDDTIIDGGQIDSVVTFASGEGPASVLKGFTLTNGRSGFDTPGFGDGGGVRIAGLIAPTSPTVTGNTITNNTACNGAGVSIYFGSPVIQGNIIQGNARSGCSGGNGGGGISILGAGSAQILDNVISENVIIGGNGGGISLNGAGTPTISGNVISGNSVSGISPAARGGGISMVNQSDALIVQNVITRNLADQGAGIYWLVPSGALGPLLVNNTIADNDAIQGPGSGVLADGFDENTLLINNIIIAAPGLSGASGQTAMSCGHFRVNMPILEFNNIFSLQGDAYASNCNNQTGINGNISADPLFVDAVWGDYRLRIGSPSADAGDNTAPNLPDTDFDKNERILDGDGDGVATVDIGAIERLVNEPPIADAGPDQTVNSFQTVVLDGSGSFDTDGEPDGSDLSFEWSIGGSVIAAGPIPTVGPFAVGLITITLEVTDAQGDIDFDIMILTVQTLPPVADAGPDQTITDIESVVLDGTGSFDPEGTPLSFAWTIAGGQIATGSVPTVGPFTVGTHEITLTVTDGDGATAADIMILTVVPAPPVAVDDLALLPNGRTVTVDVLANDEDVFGAGLAIVSSVRRRTERRA